MLRFFGWLWVLAGTAVAIITLGFGFPIYAPMMMLGCVLLIAGQRRYRYVRVRRRRAS